MVLAEAMAAGLSIVTTTSGAIPEVVRGGARRAGGAGRLDRHRARARRGCTRPAARRARPLSAGDRQSLFDRRRRRSGSPLPTTRLLAL